MTADDNRRIAALAGNRAIHHAFQWFHLHQQQLRLWQLEFLAIPAPPFGEAKRAHWFIEQFLKLDLQQCHIDSEGNALAELRADGADDSTPVILVSAHLDTVFPEGTDCRPRFDPENDALIRCPGACDNGAGLTALLGLAAALKSARISPSATILFCANVGEEGEGNLRGMRQLFNQPPYQGRIRAAIALEGGGTTVVVDRALGSRRLRVTIFGPGGHSWADSGRPNPILALASALLSVANLQLPTNPRTTLNCGTISGGTSVNSIPASASADLDLRSSSSLELDRIELSVLSTVSQTLATENRSAPANMQMKLQVERIGDRPSGYLSPNEPLARSLRAVDRHLNLSTDSHIGSTDANLPLSLEIPALAIGAGGTGAGIHTLQETYDPTGRDLALRRILLLVLDACSLISE
jgi:tripeptide aminopeptidase